MIKIKKITSLFIILLFFSIEANAAFKDSLFATIENKAITRSDIVNEIKTILILNGQSFSQKNANQLEAAAVKSTIQRTIKKIEIERYDLLTFDQNDFYKELNNLANNVNVDVDTLKNIFAANGIDFVNITDHIKTELLWNSLIFRIYKNNLRVDSDEINEQLQLIQNKEEVKEYLISEIIIKNVPQEQTNEEIKKLKNKIATDGFKQVAISSSISETSTKGGDLGWVNENSISKEFKNKIINTPVGKVSEPIILQKGILLFKVRDKRALQKFDNLEDAKNHLINTAKIKILNMHSLSHYDNIQRRITINYH